MIVVTNMRCAHSPTYSLTVGGAIASKNENRNLRERMIKSENLTYRDTHKKENLTEIMMKSENIRETDIREKW